jgi:NCAIR mutase (PurE)-related protein
MREIVLRELLEKYRTGEMTGDDVIGRLRDLPYEDLGFARIDHHRGLRWGFPEVIFCEGKTPDQVEAIARGIIAKGENLLAPRASDAVYEHLRKTIPDAVYDAASRTITRKTRQTPSLAGRVLIITAGTTDLPVAGEALVTARMLGLDAEIAADIGVAGVHRVLDVRDKIEAASVIIVIAGMEGALPSVIGGMTGSPLIAVPTSTGYGTSLGGIAPLLGMLNSCVPGIAVMNIDNGFGAAFLAFRILSASGKLNGVEK